MKRRAQWTSTSSSPAKQSGASLVEVFLAISVSLLAAGVVTSMYLQSAANSTRMEAANKVQMLLAEIDAAYPSRVFNGATAAHLVNRLRPDHPLRRGAGIALAPGEDVTLTPGAPLNGVSHSLQVSIAGLTTTRCQGVIQGLKGVRASASKGAIAVMTAGTQARPSAINDACDATSDPLLVVLNPTG